MNRVRIRLPGYEHIHLHSSIWTGVISVYREPRGAGSVTEEAGPRRLADMQRVLVLAPAGKVWGQNIGELMRETGLFSGEHVGKADLKVGSNTLRIEAKLMPAKLLFGAVTVPAFIYTRCQAKVYVNDALYFEHLFL